MPWRFRWVAALTAALVAAVAARAASVTEPAGGEAAAEQRAQSAAAAALVYDAEDPYIGYGNAPSHNRVARLEERIKRGEVKLEFVPPRGYLDSLLKALDIDPSSQTLVFSKTSLQFQSISPATPRALYFNDDTYVGWVPHTPVVEIATMDSALGAVFYMVSNGQTQPPGFQRETSLCLSCHDTFSLKGGGVPRFLFLSAYRVQQDRVLTDSVAQETTDATPISERWGGWYVTGDDGGLVHLGNILAGNTRAPLSLARVRRGDLVKLDALFDTSPYLTDRSDVIALLVFEHQAFVHDLTIRSNYKARMFLQHEARGDPDFDQLSAQTQKRFRALLEPLVRGLTFADAAPLPTRMASGSGFDRWFQSRGPRDRRGRSLRDLDLTHRLFRYPLSFLIEDPGFDGMPKAAREYVYQRLTEVLGATAVPAGFEHLAGTDRLAALQILCDTKADFSHSPQAGAACRAAGG